MSSSRAALTIVGLTIGFAVGVVTAFDRPADFGSASPGLAPSPAPDPRLGLVHVDLMDLHAERDGGGGVRHRELMSAGELDERFQRARASGASSDRWSLYWDLVETPAGLNWSVVDGIVRRDLAAGLASLPILQGTPPQFATSGLLGVLPPSPGGGQILRRLQSDAAEPFAPSSPQAAVPTGLNEPVFAYAGGSVGDAPAGAVGINSANPWARFVAAAALRYKPGGELARAESWPPGAGVTAWEVGNEPNLSFFWSGTPEDYARYLQVAYLALKWADPGALVVHAGIADGDGAAAWYRRFLASAKSRAAAPGMAEAGFFFDRAAWHWYAYPTLLATGPAQAAELLREAGLPPKPVWVTEMGVSVWDEHPGPCWDPFSPWRATTVEQAGYVWQALSEAYAAGVERAYLFQLYDDCGNGPASYDAFGLNRNPLNLQCWTDPGQSCWRLETGTAGKARPGYDALTRLAELLLSTELLWRPAEEATRWQRILFYRPPGERVMTLWNRQLLTQTVEVQATGRSGVLWAIDAAGRLSSRPVSPSAGRYRLDLPPATNRNNPGNRSPIMAGRPVMLVESDAYAPFRAEVRPLAASQPPDFDLVVSAADGGTGVGQVRVYVSKRLPTASADWEPWGGARSWTALARGGEMTVPFRGEPGATYYFAATATDRAGNETALPLGPQAFTTIEGGPTPGASTPTPAAATPTLTRTATRAPFTMTATPTAPSTATSRSTATSAATTTAAPTASATPTRPDWPVAATLWLPALAARHQ